MNAPMLDLKDAQILIVDDVPANIGPLRQPLEMAGYQVLIASSGEDALGLLQELVPDLILLDVMMPGIDGFETCRRLKADASTADVPVIFLTARDEATAIVEGFSAGGIDYIVKPFRKEEVLVRVRTHLERAQLQNALGERNAELQEANTKLKTANRQLKQEITQRQALAKKLSRVTEREAERWGIEGFVGQSPLLQKILQNIKMLEKADSTSVLITGESGTGKELVARAVHANSARATGPFVPVNCGTIPRDLAESQLFGHLKGAFTGAHEAQTGFFDLADGGTLFLDEVGDMPYDLQVKLLRVLEDGEVMPLGARKSHTVNVRIVAATHADLVAKIHDGSFRQDLYYRVARFTVEVPPLRERREDIPLLAQHFLKLFAEEMGLPVPALKEAALQVLADGEFAGNIRELKNVVERALIESQGGDIGPEHLQVIGALGKRLPTSIEDVSELPLSLPEAEKAIIERALAQTAGNVSAAARLLGVDRFKIYRKLGRK